MNTPIKVRNCFFEYSIFELALFEATNSVRLKHNLKCFQHSKQLCSAARLHSNEMKMCCFFDHTHPYKSIFKTPLNRITFKGGIFKCVGENIADFPTIANEKSYSVSFWGIRIFKTPTTALTYNSLAIKVVNAWMNSPGHRANILNREFNFVGYGCALHKKMQHGVEFEFVLCTQNFGGI